MSESATLNPARVSASLLCLGTTPVYQRSMSFDRLWLDEVNRTADVQDYASGKSVNVARVARALGATVLATGFVGGARGDLLCQDLDRSGVAHDFVKVAAPTRQCITVIDRSTAAATELVEESSPIAADECAALDAKLRQLLPQSLFWIFSGTLAPGVPTDFYARWLPLAREVGANAMIDARGEPLKLAMQFEEIILKVNREELAATISQDLSRDQDLYRAMLRHAPRKGAIAVTLGAGGAAASDGSSCWRISVPQVKAISAVGSGDAFAAGLAVGLSRGKSLVESCRLAAACGAANAMTALAGHLSMEDVNRVLDEIKVAAVSPMG